MKFRLLSTTALSLAIGVAISSGVHTASRGHRSPVVPIQIATNPCRANSCAAKRPCGPAAPLSSCNPCAVRNPCNPCAAKRPCGPVNPCAAASVTTPCVVPRLAAVNARAARIPCRPCAATNPCSAGSPCGPCTPCNPCAARNPCNPCSAGAKGESEPRPPELTEEEAATAYACVAPHLAKAYRGSGRATALAYHGWARFNRVPYPTEAHGVRFMNNYANEVARDTYARWEGLGSMPTGSVLAKDSFIVSRNGKVSVGPLFVMTKQGARFNAATRDWRYEMIMPDGAVRADKNLQTFCNNCHRRAGAPDDHLMFLPLPYRVTAKPGG